MNYDRPSMDYSQSLLFDCLVDMLVRPELLCFASDCRYPHSPYDLLLFCLLSDKPDQSFFPV